MLLVKTKIGPSRISGIGLFADQHIPAGTLVWKFEPRIDMLLSESDLDKLSDAARDQIDHHSYFDKARGKYVLCGDNARFFNHSSNPNCDEKIPDQTIALRDILPGEELTVDYRTFDASGMEDIIND